MGRQLLRRPTKATTTVLDATNHCYITTATIVPIFYYLIFLVFSFFFSTKKIFRVLTFELRSYV